MERVIDQMILAALCLLLLPLTEFVGTHVVALLAAVVVVCCYDLRPDTRLRFVAVGAYLVAALALPVFVSFLPLVAYVLFAEHPWPLRFVWLIPLAAAARALDPLLLTVLAGLSAVACLMAWRTRRAEEERARYQALRDRFQEQSLSLTQKNRDLLAAQDYEVRLATLAERARIAREIHDNVGHLLTRSVLQVEALQVVHAGDERVRDELAAVGATLHEAMDTVRKSVHDLHDDAFDLRTRLEGVIGACGLPNVHLVYDAHDVPVPVAYCLVALVREALSNVARHSDATRVEVSLIEYPALYQLIVQDNGAGEKAQAAPSNGQPTHGLGLKSMDERVTALGGRLRAEHQPGKGFRVFASIPKEQA